VVVRAYQQVLVPDNGGRLFGIADWHTDGLPTEQVVATAACYLDIAAESSGGEVEFQTRGSLFSDDPDHANHTVQPATGSLVVFNNGLLRHKVNPIAGSGRRRMVAFHIINPESPQVPAATSLPRQLKWQRRHEAVLAMEEVIGSVLPTELLIEIWIIAEASEDGASVNELVVVRDAERDRRLNPDRSRMLFRQTTGIGAPWEGASTGTSTGTSYSTGSSHNSFEGP
jgi:hypothetical protein